MAVENSERESENAHKKKEQALNQTIEALYANDEKTVLGALSKIKIIGNKRAILPLLDVMCNQKGVVQEKAQEVLYGLNEEQYSVVLIDALKKSTYQNHRQAILQIFWNSKLNPVEYLYDFVSIAVEGNYMECLECLTIIENLEGSYDKNDLSEAILDLRLFMDENPASDKVDLLQAMADILEKYEDY